MFIGNNNKELPRSCRGCWNQLTVFSGNAYSEPILFSVRTLRQLEVNHSSITLQLLYTLFYGDPAFCQIKGNICYMNMILYAYEGPVDPKTNKQTHFRQSRWHKNQTPSLWSSFWTSLPLQKQTAMVTTSAIVAPTIRITAPLEHWYGWGDDKLRSRW